MWSKPMIRVGIDAVEVSRIRNLCQRYGEQFLRRLFTPNEIAYARAARGDRCFERLSARFAAKEALVKAADRSLPFTAIEVSQTSSGRPIVSCSLIEGNIEISLSHTKSVAFACVLLEEATSSPRPVE